MTGTALLAISTTQAILLTVGGVVLLAAGLLSLFLARRRPVGSPDIPPAMQPGPSDVDLEKPLLEKLQGWGLLMFIFMAIWIPVVWVREPSVNVTDELALRNTSVERGEDAVELFSEQNPCGVGCVQCHQPGLTGGQILFQGQPYPVPNLTNVCGRLTLEQVRSTIEQGRPGTPMPSWSIRYAGSLNDQQIQEIIDYILVLNEPNVPFEDNLCINPEAAATPTASPTGAADETGTDSTQS